MLDDRVLHMRREAAKAHLHTYLQERGVAGG
jgi:hypothetical protein